MLVSSFVAAGHEGSDNDDGYVIDNVYIIDYTIKRNTYNNTKLHKSGASASRIIEYETDYYYYRILSYRI